MPQATSITHPAEERFMERPDDEASTPPVGESAGRAVTLELGSIVVARPSDPRARGSAGLDAIAEAADVDAKSDLAAGAEVSGGELRSAGEGRGTTLQLREEELIAEKRLVQLGLVRIRRRVVTERRSVEVMLSREELTVERLPGEGRDARPEFALLGQNDPVLAERLRALQLGEMLRLPVVEEEIIIQKRPVVTHELVIDKRLVKEVQQFSETVRREDARITQCSDLLPDVLKDDVTLARAGSTLGGSCADVLADAAGAHAPADADIMPAQEQPPARGGLQESGGTLQLRADEIRVGKQTVDAGMVEVRTGVVLEPRTAVVSLTREETLVEQLPVEHRLADRPVGTGEDILDIPEFGEEVSVRKRPVVTEEITVRKHAVEHVQHVTTTLRREEAYVETHGNVRLSPPEPPLPPTAR
jgi:uncharacterized protein (TIGR02271 family)